MLNCESEIDNGISDQFVSPGAGFPSLTGAKSAIMALG